jgi:tRNA nucleotidyltransferase (CCA-adding enzyme)
MHKEQLVILRQKVANSDQQLKRLTMAYAEDVLALDEYREAKAKVLERKATLKAQATRLERGPSSWLELAGRFVKSISEATLVTSGDNAAESQNSSKKNRLEPEDRRPDAALRIQRTLENR